MILDVHTPMPGIPILLEPATVTAIQSEYPAFKDRGTLADYVNAVVCTHIHTTRAAQRHLDELTPVPMAATD